jgi:hypothetical protein
LIGPDKLKEGKYYFRFLFYDSKIEIPDIQTFIYIGKNIHGEDESPEDEFYFQDAASYLKYGSYMHLSNNEEYESFHVNKETLAIIYDLNGLIEALKGLSH